LLDGIPSCSYEYVLPSFAFDPSVGMAREDSAAAATTPATTAAAASPTSSFVFDDGVRARLNALLKRYVGTHNFHNFTIRVRPCTAPSAMTYGARWAAAETVYTLLTYE
jgi:tRNA pseudouridine38-40 synthase